MVRTTGKKKLKVHFNPDNVEIVVDQGEDLLQAAIAAGVRIYASCGGAGTCGTCKVQVEKGDVETTRTDKITGEEFSKGIRQACQSRVLSDLSIYVPVESRLEKAVLDAIIVLIGTAVRAVGTDAEHAAVGRCIDHVDQLAGP